MMSRSFPKNAWRAMLLSAAMPLAAIAQSAAPPGPTPPDPALAEGRALSQSFLQFRTDDVWALMAPSMREALGDAQALAAFRDRLAQQLGEERSVLDESAHRQDGLRVYLRTARWSKAPGPILMQWALDEAGKVQGFFVRPQPQAAPSPHLDYQTRARLRLPFDGRWYVAWGGRDIEQNYHAAVPGQRFALDLLQRVDGRTHAGDGRSPDQYYCWGEPILAPAAGTVVAAVDGLPDQAIGARDTKAVAGNHVMLDLGHGEYAMLAHLQRGSVQVEPGRRVAPGDVLGRCGNSGNTSEPHLHFHLQDGPRFGEGDGLPAFFSDYVADGTRVERGEPLRGQFVSPQAPDAPADAE